MLEVLQHIEKYHFGKPQLECHICNAICYHKIDLNEHKETVHELQSSSLKLTGKKPYECEQCHEGFGEKELFQNHIESVHEGKKPYKCIMSNISYAYRTDRNEHRVKTFKCHLSINLNPQNFILIRKIHDLKPFHAGW